MGIIDENIESMKANVYEFFPYHKCQFFKKTIVKLYRESSEIYSWTQHATKLYPKNIYQFLWICQWFVFWIIWCCILKFWPLPFEKIIPVTLIFQVPWYILTAILSWFFVSVNWALILRICFSICEFIEDGFTLICRYILSS